MEPTTQFEIIQEIATMAISSIEPDWLELKIAYAADHEQTDLCQSYLINIDGVKKEKPIQFQPRYLALLRKLRSELAKTSAEPFSSCLIHMWADGKYDVKYSYAEVDWSALVRLKGNFVDV